VLGAAIGLPAVALVLVAIGVLGVLLAVAAWRVGRRGSLSPLPSQTGN